MEVSGGEVEEERMLGRHCYWRMRLACLSVVLEKHADWSGKWELWAIQLLKVVLRPIDG